MAYVKGKKVEAGIWILADKEDLYLAEVNYRDSHTGRRIRERRTSDKVAPLRAWRNARKTDALRGEVLRDRNPGKAKPFSTFADEYLDTWSKLKKRPSSYARDIHSAKHLKIFFGKRGLGNITRRDVEKYIASRQEKGLKPGTINRELCCLKNMLRKAVEWEYIDKNPAWGVKQAKEYPPEFDFLTFEEVDRLVEVCPPHIRTFLILALNTGMRKGELFNLQWRDVRFDKGTLGIITIRESKNHETRHIPMNGRVHDALKAHPHRIVDGQKCPYVLCNEEGKPYRDLRGSFGAALKSVGVTRHIRIHDLRHTFASHLVMRGKDLRTVAKLLGHRDIRVTMRYAHLAPEHLQDAVGALDLPPPKKDEMALKTSKKTAG